MGRMGPMRFAGGGKVKRALEALERAKFELQEGSDPEFDLIADLLERDVPMSKPVTERIRRARTPEDWLRVEDEFETLQRRLESGHLMTDEQVEKATPYHLRLPSSQTESRSMNQKIRTMLEDHTEGNVDQARFLTQDPEAGFYQVEVKDLDGNSEIFEIDFQNPEAPITLLE